MKASENKKLLLVKNEFIWQKEQLLIFWKYNDYQHAKQLSFLFSFFDTWRKDKKIALLSMLSHYQVIKQVLDSFTHT
jgi:hypothetical protein